MSRTLEFARFVIVGTINTGVGYGIYLALLSWVGYQLAYAAAYVVGIVVAYVLNSMFVFRSRIRVGTALRYPLVYLGQYLFGAAVLYALVAGFAFDQRWAALIAIVASVPVSFVLNRLALAPRAAR